MGDLRPIALCNVVYKILTKVLANRLKLILGNIISESQSAFVLGRAIIDNVIVAYEMQHFMKRKKQGNNGLVALKVDMSKAYDRVEWEFLRRIMAKLAFCNRWINWVMTCISTVSLNILDDGVDIEQVIPRRGLRQGDPLSPYLFIMVAKGLSALIRRAENRGDFHGITIARGAPKVSHLFFADDSFFFFNANARETQNFKNIIDMYFAASGQTMNLAKSCVNFSANVNVGMRNLLCGILGVGRSGDMGNYLGLPSLVGRNKRDILGFIKNKIVNRIHGWGRKFLSKAGREVLLKSVIQAIPSYSMSVFLLPNNLVREVEIVMNSYWWKGEWGSRTCIKWKTWHRLCVPKKWGGMGFRKMREFILLYLVDRLGTLLIILLPWLLEFLRLDIILTLLFWRPIGEITPLLSGAVCMRPRILFVVVAGEEWGMLVQL